VKAVIFLFPKMKNRILGMDTVSLKIPNAKGSLSIKNFRLQHTK